MPLNKTEKNKWESNLHVYEAALEVLRAKITLVTMEYNRLAEENNYSEIQMITDRIKSPESISAKLEKNGLEFNVENIENRIHDVVGCRIVCLTLVDVEAIVDLLTKSLNNTEGFSIDKCKDYIKNPKENGYKSYHFRINVPVTFADKKYSIPAEIQVRTLLMHAWGELEHKLGYKPTDEMEGMQSVIRAQFNGLASMVDSTDTLVKSVMVNDTPKQKRK